MQLTHETPGSRRQRHGRRGLCRADSEAQPEFEITIFGDETHVNYNRILLSMVLAGEKSADEIVLNDIEWYRSNDIRARLGVRISRIDRAARMVIDEEGQRHALRQADSGHGQQRVHSADSGRGQRKRPCLPHA